MPKTTRDRDYSEITDEISIDEPHQRARAPVSTMAIWPEGWWAVSDGNDGYIAFFQHEADAHAFRQLLTLSIWEGGDIAQRYRSKAQEKPKQQYGVFDIWKKRWCPRIPTSEVDAGKKAEDLNTKNGGGSRCEARLLPT